MGPAPSAAAARRTGARGGVGPTYHVGPPEKRSRAAPGSRASRTTETGGGADAARAPAQIKNAAAASAADARRRGQQSRAASASA